MISRSLDLSTIATGSRLTYLYADRSGMGGISAGLRMLRGPTFEPSLTSSTSVNVRRTIGCNREKGSWLGQGRSDCGLLFHGCRSSAARRLTDPHEHCRLPTFRLCFAVHRERIVILLMDSEVLWPSFIIVAVIRHTISRAHYAKRDVSRGTCTPRMNSHSFMVNSPGLLVIRGD